MKVCELFEDYATIQTKRDWSDTVGAINKTKSKTGLRGLQGGRYSAVYDMTKEPNSVLKVARHPMGDEKQDGYFSYIQKIVQSDNPYFPKTEELKQRVTPEGDKYYSVKIEKLTSLYQLSSDDYTSIFTRIFQRPVDIHEVIQLRSQLLPKVQRLQPDALPKMLAVFVENAVEADEYLSMVKDEQMIQAIKMLRILWKAGHQLDIHEENIMVRRTPYGPHLVFTDPFSEIRQKQPTIREQPKVQNET